MWNVQKRRYIHITLIDNLISFGNFSFLNILINDCRENICEFALKQLNDNIIMFTVTTYPNTIIGFKRHIQFY